MSAVDQTTGLNSSGSVHHETNDNGGTIKTERKRKRRWGDASKNDSCSNVTATEEVAAAKVISAGASAGPLDSKAKAMALKASVAARLAALKAKTATATPIATSSSLKRPPRIVDGSQHPALHHTRPVKRAKHYELDMSVTGPTFRPNSTAEPLKPKVNPYLAHRQQEESPAKSTPKNDGNAPKDRASSMIPEVDIAEDRSDYVDSRLEQSGIAIASQRRQRRELHFVEPGTFVEIATRKRQRALNAESAGFVSGRKAGQFVQSTSMMNTASGGTSNYYGTSEILDSVTDLGVLPPHIEAISGKGNSNKASSMPLIVEWWDMEFLPSKLRKQVASFEGKALSKETQCQMQHLSSSSTKLPTTSSDEKKAFDDTLSSSVDDGTIGDLPGAIRTMIGPEATDLRTKCMELASLSYSKTAELVQHIVPIKPPNANKYGQEVEPVLHLTKKERKRQRKLRREAKLREQQDLQAAGLIPAPEPRLTLKNFIRVLGDQAYADPSKMEQKVMEQIQARQRAHLERNECRKLTKEQKAEKLRRKYEEDTSQTGVHVALFYVKNLSHPYHRTKVDLNAQQHGITGGVVECVSPQVACVICEGGPKAIKKFIRLMTARMKWKGPDTDDDEEESNSGQAGEDGDVKHKFDKANKCELVWTGMATKRLFKGFVFQACESSDEARKVLRSKGVGQYWDQVLTQASGRGESMHLKLAYSDDDYDDDDMNSIMDDKPDTHSMDVNMDDT